MTGGGPKYEPLEVLSPPEPATFLLEDRIERIENVVAQRTQSLAVVLDRLGDSFNQAAILRTCEGFGIQNIFVVEHPEAFKPNATVTQGCDKWIDIHRFKSFGACREALKNHGYRVLASTLEEAGGSRESLFKVEFSQKTALVFGNERRGVSEEVLAGADGTFWIPMRGFTQSFNVSVAVALSVSRAIAWREERLGLTGDLFPAQAEALNQKFQVLSVKQRKKIYKNQAG